MGRPAGPPASAVEASRPLTLLSLRRRSTGITLATVTALVITLVAGASPAAALGPTTTTTVPATTTTTTVPGAATTTTTIPGATTTTTAPGATTTTVPATTTTTAPPATTTTIPPDTGVPSIPTAGPPTTVPAPGSPPTTAPTAVDPGPISAAVEADLAQLAAITEVGQVSSAVATDTRMTGMARTDLDTAQAASGRATAQVEAAQASAGRARNSLRHLALAAYTGESSEPVSTTGPDRSQLLPVTQEAQEAGDMLTVIVSDQERQVEQRTRAVVAVATRAAQVGTRLVTAQVAMATATQALTTTQATLTTLDREAVTGGDAVTASFSTVSTSTGLTLDVGTTTPVASLPATTPTATPPATPVNPAAAAPVPTPSILGPATLTAAELAGWFSAAGHSANTTVPIAQLAQDYLTAGAQTGVRGDLAFAQSVIETGDFDFPAGGQLTATDNNFAGIGACDSCATGWSFPDAQTGVSAQEQLLEAYASPTRVATPLVGPVGVGGCCTTWVSLAGKWASSLTYGVEILTVYEQILDWAIPERLAAAGLAPAPAAAATSTPATTPGAAASSG
jgi:hypothetical protein